MCVECGRLIHCKFKDKSLEYVRLRYNQQWESTSDIPYADSIYKMIDDVIEYQLDTMADMELEDFYREQMAKHYEDKRNAVEFNHAWMAMNEIYKDDDED